MHHLRNHPFIPPFILTTTVLFILFKHNSLILFVNRTPRRIPFEHDGPIPLFFFYTRINCRFICPIIPIPLIPTFKIFTDARIFNPIDLTREMMRYSPCLNSYGPSSLFLNRVDTISPWQRVVNRGKFSTKPSPLNLERGRKVN